MSMQLSFRFNEQRASSNTRAPTVGSANQSFTPEKRSAVRPIDRGICFVFVVFFACNRINVSTYISIRLEVYTVFLTDFVCALHPPRFIWHNFNVMLMSTRAHIICREPLRGAPAPANTFGEHTLGGRADAHMHTRTQMPRHRAMHQVDCPY